MVSRYAMKQDSVPVSLFVGGSASPVDGVKDLIKNSGFRPSSSANQLETSLTISPSSPSTATMAPLTCCIGLVGPGAASGGLIFESTLILLR